MRVSFSWIVNGSNDVLTLPILRVGPAHNHLDQNLILLRRSASDPPPLTISVVVNIALDFDSRDLNILNLRFDELSLFTTDENGFHFEV